MYNLKINLNNKLEHYFNNMNTYKKLLVINNLNILTKKTQVSLNR